MINRMSIREFLSKVISAIIGGDVLTDPTVAEAIEQFGNNPVAEIGNPDKIAYVVSTVRRILKLDRQTMRPAICAETDALLAFMCNHFDISTTNRVEAHLLLLDSPKLGVDPLTLDEADLARLVEGLVPLAVIKSIIKNRTPLDSRVMPMLDVFARRYSDLIAGNLSPSENRQLAERMKQRETEAQV